MEGEEDDGTPNWFLEPVWQNYSSMYREAVCGQEAISGMEIAHHRMAALYFGISTLECFLNRAMTRHQLELGKEHDEIYDLLWKSSIKEKIRKWPKEVIGKNLTLRPASLDRILTMNDLRGQLTHLKNFWPEAFGQLAKTDPMNIVDLVAEYIIAFHQAKGELFPYWVWGWNYLNPRQDSYEIDLIPYTQFFHSIQALGFKFKQETACGSERHEREIMSDYEGYQAVARFLSLCDVCEPKWDRAPFQPKLCRRWWDPAHHQSCGKVTQEALSKAIEIDEAYANRLKMRTTKVVSPTSELGWIQKFSATLRNFVR